jgi:hypothetical protein
MRMTLKECKKRFPNHPQPAPVEYAGQWVAWDKTRANIVAHGKKFSEVHADAVRAGCDEPLMQKVVGTPFVGMKLGVA